MKTTTTTTTTKITKFQDGSTLKTVTTTVVSNTTIEKKQTNGPSRSDILREVEILRKRSEKIKRSYGREF